jgi:hypothetical protein
MSTHPSSKRPWVFDLCMSLSLDILSLQNTENGTQAPGQPYLIEKFHISVNLASSGLGFYLLGFATGPMICAYVLTMPALSLTSSVFLIGGNWSPAQRHVDPDPLTDPSNRPTFRDVRSKASISNFLASSPWYDCPGMTFLPRSGTHGIPCFTGATAPSAFADKIIVILLCMCFANHYV